MRGGPATARFARDPAVGAVADQREALLARQEDEVADLRHEILQMRGQDLEVFRVEGDKSERRIDGIGHGLGRSGGASHEWLTLAHR
ncbi:hypothetical protein GCM10008179_23770 [Hansschlegelia plantiphila]|uniref:Uncharacterized protein n=1 Tax=Hansschlegelia plantiphila TaxID=374655 RepID=A0A9W6MVR8_9HYPH|nr:hypothetical protein GCM10008179_23770 [Hansschlegelia plantiphila]